MYRIYMLVLSLLLFSRFCLSMDIADSIAPESGNKKTQKSSVSAKKYMVAAAHPVAVKAGVEILKQGGSAIDALVTVQTVLGLVEPQSSGLGGGGFLVYYDAKTNRLTTFDGRETAPLAVKANLLQDQEGKPLAFFDAVVGGLSVGTPGLVKLLATAQQKYGHKDWASLLQPAIKLANKGFVVSERLAYAIDKDKAYLSRYPDTKAYFFTANGLPIKKGQRLKNPAYAKTLISIAKQGEQAFYSGEIARSVVQKVQNLKDNPGLLSLKDFARYQVIERAPLCTNYREYRLCGMGPPSSGAHTLGQIFGILEHFDLQTMGASNPVSWQIIADASRLAFADRGRYIADPDFIQTPKGLLNHAYLAKRAALITAGKALQEVKAGNPDNSDILNFSDDASLELASTTHIVIVDKDRNVVSMTSSIENGFGSRVMSNGFLLNNQLTDFSFIEQKNGKWVANRVEPQKRPRSSMAPTIVFKENKPYMAIGSPGGSRIIGYVAQSLIAHIDWEFSLQSAIDMPRMLNHFGHYDIEENTKPMVSLASLEKMGYQIRIRDLNSGIHAILLQDNTMIGSADPRREGIVMGE